MTGWAQEMRAATTLAELRSTYYSSSQRWLRARVRAAAAQDVSRTHAAAADAAAADAANASATNASAANASATNASATNATSAASVITPVSNHLARWHVCDQLAPILRFALAVLAALAGSAAVGLGAARLMSQIDNSHDNTATTVTCVRSCAATFDCTRGRFCSAVLRRQPVGIAARRRGRDLVGSRELCHARGRLM